MELNSNKYSWTPQLHLVLHTICLICISWWDWVGWMFKEVYIYFTALITIDYPHHLTARSPHAPQAASYGSADTAESSISLLSWCWVCSSDHAGLSFEPLQRAGGNHVLCYHNHWIQWSIAMYVELCFAPVGQPVQMPAAAHSIHWTSKLLPHGLLLWDFGLSHPLSV
jgi:hypothetical protein